MSRLPPPAGPGPSRRRLQAEVFALTFFSYVSFHVTRKVFSVIKSNLEDDDWFGSTDQSSKLGMLDALFLFMYAFGLYVSGILGDRFDLRKVIVLGMCLSGVTVLLFGLGGFLGVHALGFYAAVWGLNGLVQSSGWPANVAVMGNWFSFEERGSVMGLWAGNASFGNICGTGLVALILVLAGDEEGWKLAMVASAGVIFVEAAMCWFWLFPTPESAGVAATVQRRPSSALAPPPPPASPASPASPDPLRRYSEVSDGMGAVGSPAAAPEEAPPIGFWKAWLIPGVLPYAMSYACLKAVNYALFFWLPLYLKDNFEISSSRADFISMLYDAGQIFGSLFGGYVTDRMGVRAPVIVTMMLLSSTTLYFFQNASLGWVQVLLVVAGFLMGGPANLISGCISADLGSHESLRGNSRALSTVTGIIDGTGSVGAAFVQYLVGYLKDTQVHCTDDDGHERCTHWDPIFLMLIVGDIVAALCLSSLLVRDLRTLIARQDAEMGSVQRSPLLGR